MKEVAMVVSGSRMKLAARPVRTLLLALALSDGAAAPGAVNAWAGRCIVCSYDGTGNRTTVTTAATAPTWGTGIWGCIYWTVD